MPQPLKINKTSLKLFFKIFNERFEKHIFGAHLIQKKTKNIEAHWFISCKRFAQINGSYF